MRSPRSTDPSTSLLGSTDQERSGDLTSMPLHMADVGTDTMQEELDASNDTRISRELADIDDALSRLYRSPDRFGIAESTGAPISIRAPRRHSLGPNAKADHPGRGRVHELDFNMPLNKKMPQELSLLIPGASSSARSKSRAARE